MKNGVPKPNNRLVIAARLAMLASILFLIFGTRIFTDDPKDAWPIFLEIAFLYLFTFYVLPWTKKRREVRTEFFDDLEELRTSFDIFPTFLVKYNAFNSDVKRHLKGWKINLKETVGKIGIPVSLEDKISAWKTIAKYGAKSPRLEEGINRQMLISNLEKLKGLYPDLPESSKELLRSMVINGFYPLMFKYHNFASTELTVKLNDRILKTPEVLVKLSNHLKDIPSDDEEFKLFDRFFVCVIKSLEGSFDNLEVLERAEKYCPKSYSKKALEEMLEDLS